MPEKFISLLLAAIITVSLAACSPSARNVGASGDVISPGLTGKRPVITILYYPSEFSVLKDDYFKEYKSNFVKQYGVEVKLEGIGFGDGSVSDRENYQKELMTKLYAKDGPELIFYQSGTIPVQSMIRQKAVMDVKNKIPNLYKIYNTLLESNVCYVPIGIYYNSYLLNKKAVDDLRIPEIKFDWTSKDCHEVRKIWIAKSKRLFDWYEYIAIYDDNMDELRLYDSKNNKVSINTPEVKNAVQNMREEIFSGNYILDKGYTYNNFHNMFRELQSEEYKEHLARRLSEGYKSSCLWNVSVRGRINLLLAKDVSNAILLEDAIPLPQYKDRTLELSSIGFVVNKNGRNPELALEFINGLLDDKAQIDMFNEPYDKLHYYPVSKDIEEQIRKQLEKQIDEQIKGSKYEQKLDKKSVALSEYALSQIKNGKVMLDAYANEKEGYLYNNIWLRMMKFIFADKPYSDEELAKELQKLEDELNIWLNE